MKDKNLVLIGSSVFFYSALAFKCVTAQLSFFQIILISISIGVIEGILGHLISKIGE